MTSDQPQASHPILGAKDPRAISEKIVVIDGKEYRVNVLPPGPEEHDETVWRFPEPHLTEDFQTYIYHGCGTNQLSAIFG